MVDGIAFVSYLLMSMRLTPSLRDLNGYPVDLARFLEWFATCPSLILLIGEVTKCHQIATVTMRYDYVMLVCGFMAAITREPYSTYFSFGALSCFTQVITGLDSMFVAAQDPQSGCKLERLTIQTARYATVASWASCIILQLTNSSSGLFFNQISIDFV